MVEPGWHAQASLRLIVSSADYREVFTGDVTQLYAQGRLRIEGNLGLGLILARMLASSSSAEWHPDRRRIEEVSAKGKPLATVERREMPSLDVFQREYARACRPVILTDVVRKWELGALSPERLRADCGSQQIVPRVGDYVSTAFTARRAYVQMSLADYLELIFKPHAPGDLPPYLGNNPLSDTLLGHIEYPPFFTSSACGRPSMWLGPGGTITPLHRDLVDNALAQVFGRKSLLLFSPEQSRFLYPSSGSELIDGSPVDPAQPDFQRFPLFAEARGIPCVLEPGEMLFLPAGWFHHVRSLTPSLSINFFKLYEPPAAMSA